MIKKCQAAQMFFCARLSSKMIHVTANYPQQAFDRLRCATVNYEITKHLEFTIKNVQLKENTILYNSMFISD